MNDFETELIIEVIIPILIIVIMGIFYLIPSIIAYSRKHQHKILILFLNIFTGITFIGWIAIFIWSLVDGKDK